MALLDFYIDERLGDSEELHFALPADDPKVGYLQEEYGIQWEGRGFRIAEIKPTRSQGKLYYDVRCEAVWYELAGPKHVGSLSLLGETPDDGLATILALTPLWTVVSTSSGSASATPFTYEAQDQSVLTNVRQWAKVCGLEVVFDTVNRTVQLVDQIGADRGLAFRYGRNLLEVVQTRTPPECTRLYAYGQNDLTISGLAPSGAEYIEDFSYYTAQGLTLAEARQRFAKDQTWVDTAFIDDAALYAAAQTRLARLAQPTVSYEMKVVDLSGLAGEVPETFGLGDTVRVYDTAIGLNERTRVVRYVQYPLEPWRNVVELGNGPTTAGPFTSSYRSAAVASWQLFQSHNNNATILRNGFTRIVNRLPLRFANDGEAVYGLNVSVLGVGAGTLGVSAIDEETGALVREAQTVQLVDGELVNFSMTWAANGLAGPYTYSIYMKPSGASSASGVNIAASGSDFWILAKGAVKETRRPVTSQRFDFLEPSGGVQQFTVPAGVSEVTITVVGAQGGGPSGATGRFGGAGGLVEAKMVVTPAQVIDVYVGGENGWPNGGGAGDSISGNSGGPGGGSSDVRPSGGSLAQAYLVAAGGGGAGYFYNATDPPPATSAGGFDFGLDGSSGVSPGGGATQYNGGAGGTPGAGSPGTFGEGGDALTGINGFAGPGGGGGGGWYGGGSAGGATPGSGGEAGDGGGGSGYASPVVYNLFISDGANTNRDGYVVFEWEDPGDA